MSWVKLDDGLDEHRKIERLLDEHGTVGLAALGLWTLLLTSCARRGTDGEVTRRALSRLGAPGDVEQLVAALCGVGLLDATEDGWQLHDFLDYNPSAAGRQAEREAKSAAGRKGAAARWNRPADGTSHGSSHSNGMAARQEPANAPGPYPSRPVPVPTAAAAARDARLDLVVERLRRCGNVDERDVEQLVAEHIDRDVVAAADEVVRWHEDEHRGPVRSVPGAFRSALTAAKKQRTPPPTLVGRVDAHGARDREEAELFAHFPAIAPPIVREVVRRLRNGGNRQPTSSDVERVLREQGHISEEASAA